MSANDRGSKKPRAGKSEKLSPALSKLAKKLGELAGKQAALTFRVRVLRGEVAKYKNKHVGDANRGSGKAQVGNAKEVAKLKRNADLFLEVQRAHDRLVDEIIALQIEYLKSTTEMMLEERRMIGRLLPMVARSRKEVLRLRKRLDRLWHGVRESILRSEDLRLELLARKLGRMAGQIAAQSFLVATELNRSWTKALKRPPALKRHRPGRRVPAPKLPKGTFHIITVH